MSPAATKQTTAATVPLLFTLPIDPLWLVLIPVALAAAWLARAAKLVREAKPWKEILHDLGVSVLLGATVGIFAVAAITHFELGYIWGMAVTWTLAFGGVPAITAIYERGINSAGWFWDRFLEDAEAKGRKRDEAQKRLSEDALLDLTRQLDNDDDKAE